MNSCRVCNNELSLVFPVGRKDECDHCGADLHVCLSCRFYDPASYNECRESSAMVVKDKERSNFCEYFEFSNSQGKAEDKNAMLSAAESLFKKN